MGNRCSEFIRTLEVSVVRFLLGTGTSVKLGWYSRWSQSKMGIGKVSETKAAGVIITHYPTSVNCSIKNMGLALVTQIRSNTWENIPDFTNN